MNARAGLDVLADLFLERGPPEHIRSDSGPEYISQMLRFWYMRLGVQRLSIEPGAPYENGYCESFISKLRDECLNIEALSTLKEVQILAESWRQHFNAVRPDSSLGYRPTAPRTVLWPAFKPTHVTGVAA